MSAADDLLAAVQRTADAYRNRPPTIATKATLVLPQWAADLAENREELQAAADEIARAHGFAGAALNVIPADSGRLR